MAIELMRNRFPNAVFPLALCLLAAGCGSGKDHFYDKRTGLRVDKNPVLLAAFEEHKLQCEAEAAEAELSSQEKNRARRRELADTIYRACMAEHGYTDKKA